MGAIALAAASLVLAGRAFLGNGGEGGTLASGSLGATDDRAASVALGALTNAGLHDVMSDYYDYGGVEQLEDRWVTYFCSSPSERVCNPSNADSTLTITAERESLVVTDASGAFAQAQRARLIGYRESTESSPRWVIEPIAIESYEDLVRAGLMVRGDRSIPEGQMVVAAVYWTGSLPSELMTTCHIELLDDRGAVVHTREIEIGGRAVEGARDGVLLSEFPEDVDAAEARSTCEDPQLGR